MDDSQYFLHIAGAIALGMLVWNTIEVGRNDAANIVNAVFGARVMRRRMAVRIAGLAVILGACASEAVMETARKGIFEPAAVSLHDALSIYIAVYIANTVLLYSFSAFGMPVSTTACLVFALLGGGLMIGGPSAVHWDKSTVVIAGIVCSILASGSAGFLVQRAFRGAIGRDCGDIERIRLHGPWISGALLTGLVYFLLMKGMQDVGFVQFLRAGTIEVLGAPVVLFLLWCILSALTMVVLLLGGEVVQRNLFPGLAVLGMLATAFAFGQNDLANCASPGVGAYMILKHGEIAHEMVVPRWFLFICGLLLFMGMSTRNAQRVTRAEVNTGSQGDVVRLYAPNWCIRLARFIVPREQPEEALAPEPPLTPKKKLQHYDALRAAVITSISASVIAFASGLGLPVSTTYVAFAAVVATGWADRIFLRGDAQVKMGRTIWVVFCWFSSALMAALATGLCSKLISVAGAVGIVIALVMNFAFRTMMKRRADQQEARLQREASERKKHLLGETDEAQHPLFATEQDDDEM
ncbi:MAG: inorganic phosphate transporter [bacterium]